MSPRELARVRSPLAPAILAFAREHLGRAFHMDDLVRFVHLATPGHGSPSRVLEHLRRIGAVQVSRVDQEKLVYRVDEVVAEKARSA